MNKNILVTGAKGFIGKNLIKQLEKNKNYNILEFKRGDSIEELIELVLESDFVFHLAGEVRPDSSLEDFKKSNTELTEKIIQILEDGNKNTPIFLASTIHAVLLKNEYGKTKREAEILIEKYSKNNNVKCYVYRLPHVFGEGCKPNYNSVISTWIFNSINNLEINVFDRNFIMNYSYVQDIIKDFLIILNDGIEELYLEPNIVYSTTLGEVVDFINEFKINIENYSETNNSDFKQKLFNTYKDYYIEANNEKK